MIKGQTQVQNTTIYCQTVLRNAESHCAEMQLPSHRGEQRLFSSDLKQRSGILGGGITDVLRTERRTPPNEYTFNHSKDEELHSHSTFRRMHGSRLVSYGTSLAGRELSVLA
jgi:hypothetical protein